MSRPDKVYLEHGTIDQVLRKKWNKWYIPRSRQLNDLLIFFVVTIGVFLPVRLWFYQEVTHHMVHNLGVVSIIAVCMFLLIRSEKIGFVGRAFRRQMMRFTSHNTFKIVLLISMLLNIYLGVSLYFMERGEFHFAEERNTIGAIYVYDLHSQRKSDSIKTIIDANEYPSPEYMIKAGVMTSEERLLYADHWLNDDDFAMSVTSYETNLLYGGWPSHFNTVYFVERLETVGLWFLYRRWYYKKADFTPWCGFNANIKKIMSTGRNDKLNDLEIDTKFFLSTVGASILAGIGGYIIGGTTTYALAPLLFVITIGLVIYKRRAESTFTPKQKRQMRNLILMCFAFCVIAMAFLIR